MKFFFKVLLRLLDDISLLNYDIPDGYDKSRYIIIFNEVQKWK